jgi:peptide/nickel transport system substrate-binding protein
MGRCQMSARTRIGSGRTRPVKSKGTSRTSIGAVLLALGALVIGACTAPAPSGGATASASAAQDAPRRGGQLNFALTADPLTLDTISTPQDVTSHKVTGTIYDSLTRVDWTTGKVLPELATEWKQVAPLTWEFKLRQGVQFHKGFGEFTSDDVAFHYNTVIEKKTPLSSYSGNVRNVEVVDKYTVRFNLSAPFAPFVVSSTSGAPGRIVSRKAWESKGAAAFALDPIGTGAFTFAEWVKGDHLLVRRNEQYWNRDLPYLDSLQFRVVPDPSVQEQLLRAGQIQLADAVVYQNVAQLKQAPGLQVLTVPNGGADFLGFNASRPPFDKKAVRQAISYAIDRQAIATSVYFGEATPDDNPLPVGIFGGIMDPHQTLYPNTANLDKARQLLASAGVTGTVQAKIIVRSIFPADVRAVTIIADQLAKIGINLTITTADPATYTREVFFTGEKMAFDMNYFSYSYIAPDVDTAIYQLLHTGQVLPHGHNNPTMEGLLKQARADSDPAKRVQAYRAVMDIVLDEVPIAFLVHQNILRPATAKLKGYELERNLFTLHFDRAWFTP